jgi:hypothetical protein
MPLKITRTPFLSQIEDMQAYISQYEEVKSKQDNQIIEKNTQQVQQQSQPLYNQQNSNDFVNNFLIPPNLNGYTDMSNGYPVNNQSIRYNTQNMYYQQTPVVDSTNNAFSNMGINNYYTHQNIYNEYYKNLEHNMNHQQGVVTNNSTGSTLVQSPPPMNYGFGNNMQYPQTMKQDTMENGFYSNNQIYQNIYTKTNNQIWRPYGSSSVWS